MCPGWMWRQCGPRKKKQCAGASRMKFGRSWKLSLLEKPNKKPLITMFIVSLSSICEMKPQKRLEVCFFQWWISCGILCIFMEKWNPSGYMMCSTLIISDCQCLIVPRLSFVFLRNFQNFLLWGHNSDARLGSSDSPPRCPEKKKFVKIQFYIKTYSNVHI